MKLRIEVDSEPLERLLAALAAPTGGEDDMAERLRRAAALARRHGARP